MAFRDWQAEVFIINAKRTSLSERHVCKAFSSLLKKTVDKKCLKEKTAAMAINWTGKNWLHLICNGSHSIELDCLKILEPLKYFSKWTGFHDLFLLCNIVPAWYVDNDDDDDDDEDGDNFIKLMFYVSINIGLMESERESHLVKKHL